MSHLSYPNINNNKTKVGGRNISKKPGSKAIKQYYVPVCFSNVIGVRKTIFSIETSSGFIV